MVDIIEETEDIFNESISSIFIDKHPLTIEYIPKKLIGRSLQVQRIVDLINPILHDDKPHNGLLYGVCGSGKTLVIKFVLNKLSDKLQSKTNLSSQIICIYISCKQINSTNDVLYTIIKEIDPNSTLAHKGHSLSVYYNQMWNLITERNLSVILVLDEIDYLKSDEILYNISRAGESGNIPSRHYFTVIGISNFLHYINSLDPRVISSMNFVDVVFEPYDALQIEEILRERVQVSLLPNVIDESVLGLCSARSAKTNGDARKAIEILYSAGEIAEKERATHITIEHLNMAENITTRNKIMILAENLPLHSKLVLVALVKLCPNTNVQTTSSAITVVYIQLCKEIDEIPLHRTTISSVISEFQMLGFLKTKIHNKGRAGGVTRQIRFSEDISIEILSEVLYNDYNLDDLRSFHPMVNL